MDDRTKVSFISLGCAKNLVNTEQMMALCRDAGMTVTGEPDGADVAVTGPSDVRARADPTLTVQILWNLFGNDLKYAAPYGRVLVAVEVRGDVVAIAFRDEGKGMTAAEMRRAFDRYYRAKTVLVSGKGGFGIGLCIAREFARAMGGDLTVAPNRPRGCVFTLTLPRAV